MATTKRAPRTELDDVLAGQGHLEFDSPSKQRLPKSQPQPVKLPIGSLLGVDALLHEMGWIQARQKELKAEADRDIQARIQRYTDQMVIEVDGKPVKFADRLAQLHKEAFKFCRPNRKKLIDEGAKSREISHGRFGWRIRKARVKPCEDEKVQTSAGKFLDHLQELVQALFAKLPEFLGLCGRWTRVQLSISRTDLLKAYLAKDLNATQLRRLGYAFEPEADEFYLEPTSQPVASTSAEAPQ